tara:strand:- start:8 stop:166 length:159 start_codon:yes stop_codon:yes gene_type:complete
MKNLCDWVDNFDKVYSGLCDAGMNCKDASTWAEFSANRTQENKGETNDYIDQ